MYHLTGIRSSLENVILLSKPHLGSAGAIKSADLKTAYQSFLKTIQPEKTVGDASSAEFILDAEVERQLIESYVGSEKDEREMSALGSDAVAQAFLQRNPASVEKKIAFLKQGREALAQTDASLEGLFSLVINRVFCVDLFGRGGGSTPKAIGIIWANPVRGMGSVDAMEFFVHELTHNLLFLDECAHRHYRDRQQLSHRENYAISAIRKTPRRADLVFHSLIVGVEILMFRESSVWDGQKPVLHPATPDLLGSCLRTLEDLRRMPQLEQLFEDRALELLDKTETALEAIRRGMPAQSAAVR